MKEFRLFKVILIGMVAFNLFTGCNHRSGEPRILVFTKTAGFHHESIAAGVPAILRLGSEHGFAVDTTTDASWFQEDSLRKYAAVVFLNTTGNILNNYQEADFERYIQAGGGFAGVHAASDAGYDWGWYGRLVGGYFNGHPAPQEAVLNVVDNTHPSTKFLPATWKRTDEWYNFKKLSKEVHVLLTIDEKSYQGGQNGDPHPMAWYHDYDGGRAWYTELGHTNESYSDSLYLKHLLGGILYAIGDNKTLDYSKATRQRVPEEDRFVKTSLVKGVFFEPTEMTILPNLDVLVAQRRGEIMLYKHDTKTVSQAGFLHVYYKKYHTEDNVEEGLLGMQADPDFKDNHFIYVYYSPYDSSVNRLSRFTMTGDSLSSASEKIVLEVKSDREMCCHTGGSIAFGNDHQLFLSAGDNTNPFDEPHTPFPSSGYGPMDDRPGHNQYDARRGAGNTNDLRGKIMRIKIKPDGSYEIPEGNLFPKNEPKARPEIYVMGDRNPYRISVDKTTGYLYWGEVGPDAQVDSPGTRGSRGYDEVNQARKAGYFGWPLFVGNNFPYARHDYATGVNGPLYDPAKPVNESRNNTGLHDLPPAQPAFIWYPYAESPDFPQVGSGGRCAMAGPVYHSASYPQETRMPDYYDGKLFIYDWTRGWFKAVTMKANGDYDNMEPFMGHTKFNAPCDVEMGPDGRLYILEYGNGWYSKNADAGLSRIDFNGGNRPPAITGFSVDKKSGSLPLKVTATVNAKDPEKTDLAYTWDFGDGTRVTSGVNGENPGGKIGAAIAEHVYTKPGEYPITVTVADAEKASSQSDSIRVVAGNEAPTAAIRIKGNQSFYFTGRPVEYSVHVEDKDDTAKSKDANDLMVTADYKDFDEEANYGDQFVSPLIVGKSMMLSYDCKTCHKPYEKSIGPAFNLVAKRYADSAGALNYLTQKIRKGGSGVWGEVSMPAHPAIKQDDLELIIRWIRSLSTDKSPSLPASGKLNATLNKPFRDENVLILSATATDKGNQGAPALSGSSTVVLKYNRQYLDHYKKMQGFAKYAMTGNGYLSVPAKEGWVAIPNFDLMGIKRLSFAAQWQKGPVAPYSFEIRLDSPDGKKIGNYSFKGLGTGVHTVARPYQQLINISIEEVKDGAMHTVYLVSKANGQTDGMETLGLWFVEFGLN